MFRQLNELFEYDGKPIETSNEWYPKAFELAYCFNYPDKGDEKKKHVGPFEKVCKRLRMGFSVLVYLPGTCMTAAAEYAKIHIQASWGEYGKYPKAKKGEAGGSITDVWRKTGDMVNKLYSWLAGESGLRPNAIYHNLDMLSDQSGNLNSSIDALNAFFALVETMRSGIVLGLADRDAGELPRQIQRAFDETVWLGDIDFREFHKLIPKELGEKVADTNKTISNGVIWLIASRLRGVDPIRAVKIMSAIAGRVEDKGNIELKLESILSNIWHATRTVAFINPEDAFVGNTKGFQKGKIQTLEQSIINPFKKWSTFTGTSISSKGCEKMLLRLSSGVIFHGPPGTGKTHLARWLAREMGLPIRIVDARDILAAPWGVAEKNVHRLFQEARQAAPCILVFDDADNLFPEREEVSGSVAGAERSIVNAALQELEGFEGRPPAVLVVLTTNRYKALDRAIKSKLDTHLRIPFPVDEKQIGEIVDNVAEDYDLKLNEDIKNKLKERFFNQLFTGAVEGPIKKPDDREKIDKGLFSAREIKQAMRRLLPSDSKPGEKYAPNGEDINRMNMYYEKMAISI